MTIFSEVSMIAQLVALATNAVRATGEAKLSHGSMPRARKRAGEPFKNDPKFLLVSLYFEN